MTLVVAVTLGRQPVSAAPADFLVWRALLCGSNTQTFSLDLMDCIGGSDPRTGRPGIKGAAILPSITFSSLLWDCGLLGPVDDYARGSGSTAGAAVRH